MNRRHFLQALPALTLLPQSLAAAFAQATQKPTAPNPLLPAFQKAQALGKPLLVLLGPTPPAENKRNTWDSSPGDTELAAGDLFGYGGQEMWTALSLCEVHVAHVDAIHKLAKHYEKKYRSQAAHGPCSSKTTPSPSSSKPYIPRSVPGTNSTTP